MGFEKRYKDPDATVKFTVDWSDFLADGETINTSAFTLDSGITSPSNSNDTTTASVYIAGGSVGSRYNVRNRITTSASQTNDYTFTVIIKES